MKKVEQLKHIVQERKNGLFGTSLHYIHWSQLHFQQQQRAQYKDSA